MKQLKKAGAFLSSMKAAIIILCILILACLAGSLIPQGEAALYYTEHYSASLAGAVLFLGLDHIFRCWWFVILVLVLCANLLLCNILHFPALLKKFQKQNPPQKLPTLPSGSIVLQTEGSTEDLFTALGFRQIEKTSLNGTPFWYARKNQIGYLGAWLCHFGMLIVIAGFGLGQMCQIEYTVYGVSGQTKPVEDSGYEMTINQFEVRLREDSTVEQYVSDITVRDADGTEKSGTLSVNSPLSLFGMKFYQNSTGWAASVSIFKENELLADQVICQGEACQVPGKEDLVLVLSAFYPDYYEDENHMPATLTGNLKNPAYLYTLYYQNQVLGMNILMTDEKITVDDYTFTFHDPQPYTLIQVKRDPFQGLAAIGALLIALALLLAFYVQPRALYARTEKEGTWLICGTSRKGGILYQEEIRKAGESIHASIVPTTQWNQGLTPDNPIENHSPINPKQTEESQ